MRGLLELFRISEASKFLVSTCEVWNDWVDWSVCQFTCGEANPSGTQKHAMRQCMAVS